MSLGFSIAIHAVPFFELLDREVKTVAETVFGAGGGGTADGGLMPPSAPEPRAIGAAMETSRRHLAQGIDAFVRRLPMSVRNDATISRAAAYALVGLADERMLHYPAGGLEGWRERLLEFELYGSALAGQEVIRQARESTRGGIGSSDSPGLLAPLHLAVLREGFEGSLRGDALGLASLTATLEDTVGAVRGTVADVASDLGPRRTGLPTGPLAAASFALWLATGFVLWLVLAGDALDDAARVAHRIESGLSATFDRDGDHIIDPAPLPDSADVLQLQLPK